MKQTQSIQKRDNSYFLIRTTHYLFKKTENIIREISNDDVYHFYFCNDIIKKGEWLYKYFRGKTEEQKRNIICHLSWFMKENNI